jgi:hypothetical protein
MVPLATLVSRAKRDQMSSPERLTLNIDTRSANYDSAQLPSMRLGHVAFGRSTDRDHHGGNRFANESRALTKLFEISQQRQRTAEERKGESHAQTPSVL